MDQQTIMTRCYIQSFHSKNTMTLHLWQQQPKKLKLLILCTCSVHFMCIFVFLWVSFCCVQWSPACSPPPPSFVLPLPIVSLPGHIIKLKIMFNSMYSVVFYVPYLHLKIPIIEMSTSFFFKEDLKFILFLWPLD